MPSHNCIVEYKFPRSFVFDLIVLSGLICWLSLFLPITGVIADTALENNSQYRLLIVESTDLMDSPGGNRSGFQLNSGDVVIGCGDPLADSSGNLWWELIKDSERQSDSGLSYIRAVTAVMLPGTAGSGKIQFQPVFYQYDSGEISQISGNIYYLKPASNFPAGFQANLLESMVGYHLFKAVKLNDAADSWIYSAETGLKHFIPAGGQFSTDLIDPRGYLPALDRRSGQIIYRRARSFNPLIGDELYWLNVDQMTVEFYHTAQGRELNLTAAECSRHLPLSTAGGGELLAWFKRTQGWIAVEPPPLPISRAVSRQLVNDYHPVRLLLNRGFPLNGQLVFENRKYHIYRLSSEDGETELQFELGVDRLRSTLGIREGSDWYPLNTVARVAAYSLNVRRVPMNSGSSSSGAAVAAPGTEQNPQVVAVLKQNEPVYLLDYRSGWYYISRLDKSPDSRLTGLGWVNRRYLKDVFIDSYPPEL